MDGEMTINQFLDEMEQLLGCGPPQEGGYIMILENTRKLKQENETGQGAHYSGGPQWWQLYENQKIEFLGQKNKIKYLEKEIEEYWVNPEVLAKAEQKILNLEVVIGDKNMMLKHYRQEIEEYKKEIEELAVDSNELQNLYIEELKKNQNKDTVKQ